MKGAEYVAEFLARVGSDHVFVLTGGACAFMVDAVARHEALSYTCFLSEQSAAMAADAVWRVNRRIGVTMATSGPGATNLITGIACSYFDSIPSLHITGQVSLAENLAYRNIELRQTGFQETKIAEMARPITKYSVMVTSPEALRQELAKCYAIAVDGRRGPVLIDIPIDIQQMEVGDEVLLPEVPAAPAVSVPAVRQQFQSTLAKAKRPVVLWGGGIGMAGVEGPVLEWLQREKLPFVASWAGLGQFDHDHSGFCGQIGVYGNRGANFILQNADAVLVLGSRLDNRQRTGDKRNFAVGATVHVVDVDAEELKKSAMDGYKTTHLDFRHLPAVLAGLHAEGVDPAWSGYVAEMKQAYYRREVSSAAEQMNSLSPYELIARLSEVVAEDAVVVGDTGAAVCWMHQAFKVKRHSLVMANGNSAMGYALPAAIGAKLASPERQVVAYVGDGGFQLNIQELQTVTQLGLDIAVVVMNNGGYGIVKQFQDLYLGSRYAATQDGLENPDFGKVAAAYGFRHVRIDRAEQLTPDLFGSGPIVIEAVLNGQTLIEPKAEMGRPINDQFPYLDAAAYAAGNRFVEYPRR